MKRANTARAKLGWWLRCLADRIDYEHSFAHSGMSFTFEHGIGAVFHAPELRRQPGCPLWYYRPDRERAFEESENPVCAPKRSDLK